MLCAFVWMIYYKPTIRGSVKLAYIAVLIYVPIRYLLDITFFIVRRGEVNHCEKTFWYELNFIPEEDTEGMRCPVYNYRFPDILKKKGHGDGK